jgi:hypothetical protein
MKELTTIPLEEVTLNLSINISPPLLGNFFEVEDCEHRPVIFHGKLNGHKKKEEEKEKGKRKNKLQIGWSWGC